MPLKKSIGIYLNSYLVTQTVNRQQGVLTSSGALACDTGEFTDRSPKDKYENELEKTDFTEHSVFGLQMPVSCQGIPSELLNPKNTWKDKFDYDEKAQNLAKQFIQNFESFKSYANEEILSGGPIFNIINN